MGGLFFLSLCGRFTTKVFGARGSFGVCSSMKICGNEAGVRGRCKQWRCTRFWVAGFWKLELAEWDDNSGEVVCGGKVIFMCFIFMFRYYTNKKLDTNYLFNIRKCRSQIDYVYKSEIGNLYSCSLKLMSIVISEIKAEPI